MVKAVQKENKELYQLPDKKRFLFRIIVPAFPSFNIYTKIAKRTTALGPILVATSANKLEKWDVEVVDENNCRSGFCPKDYSGRPDHIELQKIRPADVVGFYGSLTSTIPRLYKLAELYKKYGVKTAAGGKHIENLPKEALKNNIDAVVFGDGEQTIKELLLAWQEGKNLKKTAGLAFLIGRKLFKTKPRKLLTDFEELPLPDFNLLRYAKMKIYPVSWWRGCPYNCEFCAVKDKTRCAPSERLLAAVVHLAETRKAKNFFIVDDHFGGNHYDKKQLEETIKFCRQIAKYRKKFGKKLSFTVQIRLTAASRPQLLEAMRQADISTVCIGYESPIDEELIAMRKGIVSKQMVERTKIFHKFGFFIHGMFIFGYPHKKGSVVDKAGLRLSLKDKIKRFGNFIARAKIDTVQVLLTVPLPGTELRQRLKKEGRLYPLRQIGWEYYDGQFPLFKPDNGVSPEKIQQAVKKIMSRFYRFNCIIKIIFNIGFHFPRVVFPITLTLFTLRVRHLTKAFKKWRRLYFRNQTRRFGGYLIIRRWLKKFREGDFLEKLARAKLQFNKRKAVDKEDGEIFGF